MKKVLATIVCVLCATALIANAADKPKKHQMTDEQKAVVKELLAKYDTNKDGKLDKSEKAAMTKEDKEKWSKAMGQKKGEKKGEKESESK